MNNTRVITTFQKRLNPTMSRKSRRTGNIIIIVATGLTAILGCAALAVDYGMSVNIKNKLQRSCDAAALAGASSLDTVTPIDPTVTQSGVYVQSAATAKAKLIAASNGITVTDSQVTFPSNSRIRVASEVKRNFLFGAAIGIRTGLVSASALAGRSFITGMRGAVPLGITKATYDTYRATPSNTTPAIASLVLTRNTQEQFGPLNSDVIVGNTVHNVIALDLRSDNSGNSGALFQNDLVTGSPILAQTQTYIDPLGSSITSQGNKIGRAIDDRITAAAVAPYNDPVVNRNGGSNYSFPDFPNNDPRVVWILVGADGYAANNSNPKLNLQYFARAYIVGPVEFTKGSDPQATLKLQIMSSGEVSSNSPDVIVSDDENTYDTGAYAIRLLG